MVSARLLTTPPHLIGLDLGGTKLAGGVVTLEPDGAARLLIEERVPTPESSEALVSAMVGMVTHLIGASPHQPVSVGAGIAGHIGLDGVAVQAANTPMTVGVDLVTPLVEACSLPVRIDNDANVVALAAHRELAPTASALVAVTFGTGIGSSIQGKFSLRAEGPAHLTRVVFLIDGETMAEDTTPPFRYQFHTDSYSPGAANKKTATI